MKLLGNIAKEANITYHGGHGTPSGLVDGDKTNFSWDDDGTINEGALFSFSKKHFIGKIIVYSNDRYPITGGFKIIVDNVSIAETKEVISASKPWIIKPKKPVYGKEIDFIRLLATSDQTLSEIEIYECIPCKVLIQDGDKIKTTTGNDLNTIARMPFTLNLFEQNGMEEVSKINKNTIDLIENNKYKIVMYKK